MYYNNDMSCLRFALKRFCLLAIVIIAPLSWWDVFSSTFDEMGDLLKAGEIAAEGESRIYKGDGLYEYINGGADIYFEYGFIRVWNRRVKYKEKTFNISIYEMKSPDSAYGILTFSQHGGMKEAGGIPNGRISRGKLIFSKGRFFCMVQSESFDEDAKEELYYIGGKLRKLEDEDKSSVDMGKYLPGDGLLGLSEKYLVGSIGLRSQLYIGEGDLIALSHDKPGYYGMYDFSGKKSSLLIVLMGAGEGKKTVAAVDNYFKGKFEKCDPVNKAVCYKDKRGRYYSVVYKEGKFILVYRGEDRGVVEGLLKEVN